MKIKIFTLTLSLFLIGVIGYNSYTINKLRKDTASYVNESNALFVKIICAQQVQGDWDLGQCGK